MKGIYFPESIKTYGLRYCSPFAKALFYELISYCDAKYTEKKIYPSIETLQNSFSRIEFRKGKRKKVIASKNTIISGLKELESAGIIQRNPHFKENKQTTNRYDIDFYFWESIDRLQGIRFGHKVDKDLEIREMTKAMSKTANDIGEIKKSIQNTQSRIDVLTFGIKNMSDNLMRYIDLLEYKADIDGVKVFTRKNPLINEFAELSVRQQIESEFKREGILIRIEKAS